MRKLGAAILLSTVVLGSSGCTSGSLRSALGTAKNPWDIMSVPPGSSRTAGINPFVEANYNTLLEGASAHGRGDSGTPEQRRRYISAGFALSDQYCADFFRDADESFRRRRFGRSLTNDVGTVVGSLLNAAGAGADALTAITTGFGAADSTWRNYDDAFMVDRNLSNVRGLVLAEQDSFRERTLGTGRDARLPDDYATAQSAIRRYADFCSTLGMQALLTRAAENARARVESTTTSERRGETEQQQQQREQQTQPPAGTPALTSNAPPSTRRDQ